jgi:hypothetical protein
MADPLTRLGISRRPASDIFGSSSQRLRPLDVYDVEGVPDFSRPGWATDEGVRAAADRQALIDEEAAMDDERAALEDRRIAREREREAEGLADQFTRMRNPSAREKFFDQNEAALTGSRRYNQLAEIRQRAPSYADNVLANNLASKMEDPDDRAMFLESVARGEGTFAAKDRVDRSRIRRQQAAKLAEAGYSPDEGEEILAKGIDDARVNYAIAQRKSESSFSRDPQAAALEKYYQTLKDRASMEAKALDGNGEALPETAAEIQRVSTLLGNKYKMIAEPPASPVLTQTPPAAGARPPLVAAGGEQPPPVAGPEEEQPIPIPAPIPEEDPLDLISSGELPDAEVAKAVDRVRASVTNPLPSETYDEWKERQKSVEGRIQSAQQRHLERSIVRKEVLPAWTAAKQKMADQVSQVSRQLGIPEQQIYNSLAKKEPITRGGGYERAPDQSSIYFPILGAGEKRENDSLKKAYYTWDTQSYKGAPIRSLLKGLFGDFDVPSNAKVLEALAKERAQIPASAPSAQDVTPAKAPSGREIKIGKPERTP